MSKTATFGALPAPVVKAMLFQSVGMALLFTLFPRETGPAVRRAAALTTKE